MSTLTAAARLHLPAQLALLLSLVGALLLLFVVSFDQGQITQLALAGAGEGFVHELFHDVRHMTGVPCH